MSQLWGESPNLAMPPATYLQATTTAKHDRKNTHKHQTMCTIRKSQTLRVFVEHGHSYFFLCICVNHSAVLLFIIYNVIQQVLVEILNLSTHTWQQIKIYEFKGPVCGIWHCFFFLIYHPHKCIIAIK